jgi:hypothetical protein
VRWQLVAFLASCAAGSAFAQAPPYAPPRTADGKPDLGGVWSNDGQAPVERPDGVASVAISHEAYAASKAAGKTPSVQAIRGELRTAQIIDPPDGKLPFRNRAPAEAWRRTYGTYMTGAPSPELTKGYDTLPLRDRCLMAANAAAPPMTSQGYNDAYQFVQTPAFMVISVEMMDETRIIPVFASAAEAVKSHRPPALARWTGDSVGWWDGDTFVVETVNVDPRQGSQSPMPTSREARWIERFTRVGADELLYRTEVTDPATYTRPWTTESSFHPEKRLWEYACHEGNYDVLGILSEARRREARTESGVLSAKR